MILSELADNLRARLHVPSTGGRPTDPTWTERRLVPMSSDTLRLLERLSLVMKERHAVEATPMQVAAALIELALERETPGSSRGW